MDKLVGGLGKFDGMCVRLIILPKRADTSQHIPRIALSSNGRTADFGSANLRSSRSGATLNGCLTFYSMEFNMYKFLLAVAVVGLTACGAAKEEVQGEVAVDSAAVVVDSTKLDTDSIKSATVAAPTEGPAAK